MAIRAFTDNGRSLLARIRGLIDQGHIDTWSYDKDGDFTHTPPQFKNKAWLHLEVQNDRLRLRIIPPLRGSLSLERFSQSIKAASSRCSSHTCPTTSPKRALARIRSMMNRRSQIEVGAS
jgi:hypothetical protein